jgi:hypothetical protein
MRRAVVSDELVTIATFETPVEAELAKLRLEGEGVLCFVHGAHVAGMQMFGLSLGGVALQVRPADADQALEILAAPLEEDEAEPAAAGEDLATPVPYLDEDD